MFKSLLILVLLLVYKSIKTDYKYMLLNIKNKFYKGDISVGGSELKM